MIDTPLPMRWQGDSFTPLNAHWAKQADKQLVVGQVYRITTVEERSAQSHKHYFSVINEAWMNLPPHLAEQFPNSEALRKFALIKSGFADERSIVCASKAEAQRVAAFIRPMDTYALVIVSEAVVKVFTAQSQSVRAMGRKVFAESKEKVFGVLAALLDVTPQALLANQAA